MEDRVEFFQIQEMERSDKISRIPKTVANRDLKRQLDSKLHKLMQHNRDFQLNKKRMLELDLDSLIKQIKKEDFDKKMRTRSIPEEADTTLVARREPVHY